MYTESPVTSYSLVLCNCHIMMEKKCELYYIAHCSSYNITQCMTGVLTVFYSAGFERNMRF